MRKNGWDYLKSMWNWIDITFFVSFIIASSLDAISCFKDNDWTDANNSDRALKTIGGGSSTSDSTNSTMIDLPDESGVKQCTRICYAILVIAGFVKLLGNVQIYEDASFLIKMMQVVTVEIIPFAILFFSMIIIFAFALAALNVPLYINEDDFDYAGLNAGALSYFMFVLRTALGDFQVSTLKIMQTSTLYTAWIFWIVLVIINSVIFLNFLIAVISDVYAQVMQTRMEEVFQKKAEILVDLDEVFGQRIKAVESKIRVTR